MAAAVAAPSAPLFTPTPVPPPHAPDPTAAYGGGGAGNAGAGSGSSSGSVLASLAPKSSAATIALAKSLGVRPFVDIDADGRKVPDYSTPAGRAAAASASSSAGSGGRSSGGAVYGPQLPPAMGGSSGSSGAGGSGGAGARRPLTTIRVGPAAQRAPPSMLSSRFTGAFSLGSGSRALDALPSTADMFYGVDPAVARARALLAARAAQMSRDDNDDTADGTAGSTSGSSSGSATTASDDRRPPPLRRPTSITVDLKGCKNPMEAANGAQPKPPAPPAAAGSDSAAVDDAGAGAAVPPGGAPAGGGGLSAKAAAAIAAAAADADDAPKAENVDFMSFL